MCSPRVQRLSARTLIASGEMGLRKPVVEPPAVDCHAALPPSAMQTDKPCGWSNCLRPRIERRCDVVHPFVWPGQWRV